MRFLINRCVWNDALLSLLVMPLPTSCAQDGVINSNGSSGLRPGIDQRDQMTPEQANVC